MFDFLQGCTSRLPGRQIWDDDLIFDTLSNTWRRSSVHIKRLDLWVCDDDSISDATPNLRRHFAVCTKFSATKCCAYQICGNDMRCISNAQMCEFVTMTRYAPHASCYLCSFENSSSCKLRKKNSAARKVLNVLVWAWFAPCLLRQCFVLLCLLVALLAWLRWRLLLTSICLFMSLIYFMPPITGYAICTYHAFCLGLMLNVCMFLT